MANEYAVNQSDLTAVADAIRSKGGTSNALVFPDGYVNGINALPEAGSGAPNLQSKTVAPATSSQTVTPDSGYDGLSQVTVNAMPTAEQATPSISVSTDGLITASATQTAGYVAAGTKSATQQLTTQAAQTITPGTTDKTIASGRYLTGAQTIKGDANLSAGNIKNGISIFGVAGTLKQGVTVQRTSGTFTTDSSGNATVNCGFQPDLVVIHLNEKYSGYNLHTAVAFNEDTRTGSFEVCFWAGEGSSVDVYDAIVSRTSTGFSAKMATYDSAWKESAANRVTFNYAAVKYT